MSAIARTYTYLRARRPPPWITLQQWDAIATHVLIRGCLARHCQLTSKVPCVLASTRQSRKPIHGDCQLLGLSQRDAMQLQAAYRFGIALQGHGEPYNVLFKYVMILYCSYKGCRAAATLAIIPKNGIASSDGKVRFTLMVRTEPNRTEPPSPVHSPGVLPEPDRGSGSRFSKSSGNVNPFASVRTLLNRWILRQLETRSAGLWAQGPFCGCPIVASEIPSHPEAPKLLTAPLDTVCPLSPFPTNLLHVSCHWRLPHRFYLWKSSKNPFEH
jgi:hypothetical protein